MDHADFDQLARSLVTHASRRRVLAGTLSAALGLLLPPAASPVVRADRKHRHKRHKRHKAKLPKHKPAEDTPPEDETCPPGHKRCQERCIHETACCGTDDCPSGLRCCAGVCQECCGQDAQCATGNVCTRDWCRSDGVCIHEPANGVGDICAGNGIDHSYCQEGQCLQCKELGL